MSDRYKEIRALTDEQRRRIHAFAMKRSREMSAGISEPLDPLEPAKENGAAMRIREGELTECACGGHLDMRLEACSLTSSFTKAVVCRRCGEEAPAAATISQAIECWNQKMEALKCGEQ